MKKNIFISLFILLFASSVFSLIYISLQREKASVSVVSSSTFKKKEGSFSYVEDYTDIYFYDDEYFFASPSEYNPKLATMSFCLALSAFSAEGNALKAGSSDSSIHVQNLLCNELGYKHFSSNEWYSKEPEEDSIAVCAANKKLRDENGTPYTIIAVAVRGGGYGKEWISNFTVGESGQAKGFFDAKEQVLTFLNNYIADSHNEISGTVKLWITGFSRGAAISNLVAGAIDDNPDMFGSKIDLSKENIFAYCFATPMGELQEHINSQPPDFYSNIWNVINENDPVPYVAMNELGFARFGNDHHFPSISTDKEYASFERLMKKYYKELARSHKIDGYSIDDFAMKKINLVYLSLVALNSGTAEQYADKIIEDDSASPLEQADFLEMAIDTIAKENVGSRSNYVKEFESGIKTIINTIYGSAFAEHPAETTNRCFDIFIKKLQSPINIAKIIYGIFEADNSPAGVVSTLLRESMGECGINVPPDKVPELQSFAKAAISLVAKFALKHPNLTVTLISNFDIISAGHNHELYFACLKAEDSNYSSNPVS